VQLSHSHIPHSGRLDSLCPWLVDTDSVVEDYACKAMVEVDGPVLLSWIAGFGKGG
jgi:hypothetical protein